MATRTRAIATIAAHELTASVRGRTVPAFAALFALLAVGIALEGLGASGQVLVQGFTRTAVSLLTLSVYLLPLFGLVLGAAALGGEAGAMELLLAQPIGRGEALIGRAAGLAVALLGAAAVGFASAAALIAAGAGWAGAGGYLVVAVGSALVGLAGLAIGVLIGAAVRQRAAAVGIALGVWLAAALLYDLAAIAVLQVTGNGEPGPWLVALLALNPVDGVRALGLVALGADTLLGPTGAALRRLMGDSGGAAWVVASTMVWLAGALAAAVTVVRRRDY